MIESLDKLVQFAQISGGVNVHCHFQGEWLVEHQCQTAQAIVHIVVDGEGWLKVVDGDFQKLKKGDIVLLSRACNHQLSYSQGAKKSKNLNPTITQQGSIQIRKIQNGQGHELQLFCACFHYEPHSELFINLPECLTLNLSEQKLQPILSLLQQEIEQPSFSQQIINSLSNVLLITIIRSYLQQQPNEVGGILNAVQDHRLSSLIQQILQAPEQDWAVEKMVAISHISRAQLMRIFKQKIAETPHAFVLKIRLQKAAMLLKNSADSVLNIALSVGFQSETHFSKAFKTLYGISPNLYRKEK